MKIYVIIGDNGEAFEDYYEWVDSVYIDKWKFETAGNGACMEYRIGE